MHLRPRAPFRPQRSRETTTLIAERSIGSNALNSNTFMEAQRTGFHCMPFGLSGLNNIHSGTMFATSAVDGIGWMNTHEFYNTPSRPLTVVEPTL